MLNVCVEEYCTFNAICVLVNIFNVHFAKTVFESREVRPRVTCQEYGDRPGKKYAGNDEWNHGAAKYRAFCAACEAVRCLHFNIFDMWHKQAWNGPFLMMIISCWCSVCAVIRSDNVGKYNWINTSAVPPSMPLAAPTTGLALALSRNLREKIFINSFN